MRAGILHICTGLLILLLVGFTGCSRKKVPLDEKKFTALLIDLHRTDGTLSVARGLSGLNELKNYAYYNDLFRKYGITRAEFDSCMYYYSANTELFSQMYDVVIDSLNRQMTAVDMILREFYRSQGAKPSFLGYGGFTGSACISINDEVIHGIPSKTKIIRDGDIVKVDTGAYIDGFHGDNAATFAVGEVSDEAKKLMDVTEQSLYEGIRMAKVGNRIGDISHAIEEYVTSRGYAVVKKFVGHGVGHELHESPEVPNYGHAGKGVRLAAGMTLAIEPMINIKGEGVNVLADGWTVKTASGSLSAHFEHTIAITNNGPVILTRA